MSAYHEKAVEVVDFTYHDDLHLARKINAVRRRAGDDADYVVAKDYQATITFTEPGAPDESELTITVPKGMLTDLCSVPRPVWWIVNRVGPHLEASITHDWLYVAWQVEKIEPTDEMKKFADDVFLAAMEKANVGGIKRWAIHRAVHLFGRSAFRSCDASVFVDSEPASEGDEANGDTPPADASDEHGD